MSTGSEPTAPSAPRASPMTPSSQRSETATPRIGKSKAGLRRSFQYALVILPFTAGRWIAVMTSSRRLLV